MEYFAVRDMKTGCDLNNVNVLAEFDLHLEQAER
jgi:hypothetical protein